MYMFLMLGSGIFWTATYILIIRRGFIDRTYGMPLVALGANISWEFIFSFVLPHGFIQRTVDIVWFCLDAVILFQLLRLGHKEFSDLRKSIFYTLCGLALITCFGSVLLITIEFKDYAGAYAAFGQNLMMSILFITMLYRRRSLRGQSISIAICKLIGTACASLAFFLYASISQQSVLLPFLYVAILGFDIIYVIYVAAVYRQQRGIKVPAKEA